MNTNSYGQFISSPPEKVYKITPKRFATDISTNSLSANIISNTALFENQVIVGEYIYIKTDDNENNMLAIVKHVHNNNVIEIETNAYFSSTNSSIYYANVSSSGFISNLGISSIRLSNVSGVFKTNDELIGITSGSYLKIDSISRNDDIKSFNTFIQLYKYNVDIQVEGFIQNELLYHENNQGPRAYIHSILTNGSNNVIYTSNQIGQFEVGQSVIGNTSGAIATITKIYEPEIVFGSGDILYIENIEPLARTNTQSETFKVIFEF